MSMYLDFKRYDLKEFLVEVNSEEKLTEELKNRGDEVKEKVYKLAEIRKQNAGAMDCVYALLFGEFMKPTYFLLGYIGKSKGHNLSFKNKPRTGGLQRAGINKVSELEEFYNATGIKENSSVEDTLKIIRAEAKKPSGSSAFTNANPSIKEKIVLVCEQLLAL